MIGNNRKLTAALRKHKNQVELLRYEADLGLRICGCYIWLQLAVGSWISAHPIPSLQGRFAMTAFDLFISILAALILSHDSFRRREVIAVVRHLNEVLGYAERDVYLKGARFIDPRM